MSEQIEELEIKELQGVGVATVKKLKDIGISTVRELSVKDPNQLAKDANISKETAASYTIKAITLLEEKGIIQPRWSTAKEQLERRKKIERITTGSNELDKLLGNGIGNLGLETGAMTEFYGEFGSGKSQVCHTLAVMATLPIEQGGLDANTLYIDTEGTYRPERIVQIAQARGLDGEQILSRILHARVYNTAHFQVIISEVINKIHEFKARVVVVDSIIALHRAEQTGRGELAERQQELNHILNKLQKISERYSLAVIITNQVVASPDPFTAQFLPTGGTIIGHRSTYRIYLRKSGRNRIARMIDSPYHETSEVKFAVTEKGVEDTVEK